MRAVVVGASYGSRFQHAKAVPDVSDQRNLKGIVG